MMIRFEARIAALAIGIVISLAGPAAAENVLRWARSGAAFGFDPHSMTSSFDDALRDPVYESLVALDSDMTISGHLATSWKPLDSTSWEFELRENVRFHDGTPFTAADVVFSIRRAQAETSAEKDTLEKIVAVEAIDPLTVRVTTGRPAALLWYDLAYVRIMSRAWAERYGVTRPADPDRQEQTYALDHANGTGPFILERFAKDGGYVMVRNPDWWGYERYPHNIGRIVRLPVTSTEEGVEMLLNGDIDFFTESRTKRLTALRAPAG